MYLRHGDLIGIVSPSRAISEIEIEAAVQLLEKEGFRVAVGKNAHKVHHQFGGSEEERTEDFQQFIDYKEVKAIWSSRGGYGAVRIIDKLDFRPLKESFKWLVGYSDFTVFHAQMNKLGMPSIHGTMPVNVRGKGEQEDISNKSLLNALKGEDLLYELPAEKLNKVGDAEGQLVGGNLSILYSLSGTDSALNTRGKILFIEDLDEYLYHIDRMMMNLKRSDKLSELAALIVGGMSEMNDNTIPYGKTAEEIILEHTQAYDYPVYFNFKAGHVQPNYALRLGKNAFIKDNSLILPA